MPGFVRISNDDILQRVQSITQGVITLKGSWNSIVTEAKRFRAEAFYKDKEQFYEADKYPDYFVAELAVP